MGLGEINSKIFRLFTIFRHIFPCHARSLVAKPPLLFSEVILEVPNPEASFNTGHETI